jgi:hypothetical protein
MYVRAYVVVIMCVCPRNYLNNVQDIIKLHFCQLRLVVSEGCNPSSGLGVWGGRKSEVSNRVLFGGWDFFFYHHKRRRIRGGSYVSLSVSFFFVCPRNYLNNVQDIIKVHFCQLRLMVSFNNILYT